MQVALPWFMVLVCGLQGRDAFLFRHRRHEAAAAAAQERLKVTFVIFELQVCSLGCHA